MHSEPVKRDWPGRTAAVIGNGRAIAKTAEILDHELSDRLAPITYLVCGRLKHVQVLHAQRISRANYGW
jgi:hypothetical protein